MARLKVWDATAETWVNVATVTNNTIGDRTYTEENYVATGQDVTQSIDALDMAVKDNADDIEALQNVKIAYGFLTITPVADTPTPGAIDYSSTGFTSTPSIVATASSSSAAVLEISYSDADEDGANIYLRRSNTTNTGISWIAIGT